LSLQVLIVPPLGPEGHHQQSATCDECGGPRSDRYQEVRPRFDAADAWQSPLAWRAWARQVQSHLLDSSLPYRYRATVSSCWLFRFLKWHRDVINAPLLVISSSCRRTVWTRVAFGRFLYSVRDYRTLCLDCCVTLVTALLALAILWRHSFSQSTSAYSALGALVTMRYTNPRFTYLLTYSGLGVRVLSLQLQHVQSTPSLYTKPRQNDSKMKPKTGITTSKDRHYASATVTSHTNRKPAIRTLRHRVSAAHESQNHKSHRKWLTQREYTDIFKLKTWKVEILTPANLLQRFSIKSLWYRIDFRAERKNVEISSPLHVHYVNNEHELWTRCAESHQHRLGVTPGEWTRLVRRFVGNATWAFRAMIRGDMGHQLARRSDRLVSFRVAS